MDKNKAIQLLERLQDPEPYEPHITSEAFEAFQMAIDALSADGDTISRKAVLEIVEDYPHGDWNIETMNDMNGMVEQLPPANNSEITNSSDAINRRAAIEACGGYLVPANIIRELPPAQPEIIRCKDCKHRDPEDKKCDCGHDIEWQLPRQDDWFCADAER